MSGSSALRALESELRALGTTVLSAEQLAEAASRAADRVENEEWEERMGEDL